MKPGIIGIAHFGWPSETYGHIDLKAVLVLGTACDVAAYVGEGSPEWISSHGDKLSPEAAALHFPTRREMIARRP